MPPILCASSVSTFWIVSFGQLCNQGDVKGQLLIQNGEKISLRGGEQFVQGERRVFTLQNASNPVCIFGSNVLDQLLVSIMQSERRERPVTYSKWRKN